MNKSIKSIISSHAFNILSVILFTLAVLWFTLKDSYNEVIATLNGISLGWLLFIVLVSILIQCVIGVGLTLLTKLSNPQYKLRQGILNSVVGSFFCGVTPSASGGQFAQVYIFKKQGVDLSDAASILWMEFIIYQTTMVLFGLFLIIVRFKFFLGPLSSMSILVILGFLVNSAIIFGLWALGRFPKAYSFVSTKGLSLAYKLRIIKDKEKALEMLNIELKRFGKETEKLQNHKLLIVQCVLVDLIRLTLYYALPYYCAKALNIDVNMGQMLDIIALASFVSTINAFIPIPGSSGGTEITFVFMFSFILGEIGARSTMIIWRVATFYLVMIFGGLTFIYAKQMKSIVRDYGGNT